MLLNNDYVLSDEVVNKVKCTRSLISNIIRHLEDSGDMSSVIKMGQFTFLKRSSDKFTKKINETLQDDDYTDMYNKLPKPYFDREYNIKESELLKTDIIKGTTKICGKKFYVFNDWFINKMKKKVMYILDDAETNSCTINKQIDGHIKLSKNKNLTWYSLRK